MTFNHVFMLEELQRAMNVSLKFTLYSDFFIGMSRHHTQCHITSSYTVSHHHTQWEMDVVMLEEQGQRA